MRVHVTELKPGDCLKADTFSAKGIHVLPKGTRLQSGEITRLIRHGVDYVSIEALTAEAPLLSARSSEMESVVSNFDQTIDGYQALYAEALATGRFNPVMVDEMMGSLLQSIGRHKDVITLLLLLDRNEDEYTYKHSLQVGMLSYFIASWLGYSKQECYDISRAGYLIDIGKCRIPAALLNKPGKLTEQEFEHVKLHTVHGHDIIRESMDDRNAALAALQHHEREDGSGYPGKLKLADIHPFAQVTAIADVYSAMTTPRVYQSKQEMLSVLRELHNLSFGKLNGKSVHAFIRHLMPNFIGKRVLLSNGDLGVIVMNNPIDVFRPLVQSEGKFLDLSRERNVAIIEIYME